MYLELLSSLRKLLISIIKNGQMCSVAPTRSSVLCSADSSLQYSGGFRDGQKIWERRRERRRRGKTKRRKKRRNRRRRNGGQGKGAR